MQAQILLPAAKSPPPLIGCRAGDLGFEAGNPLI
jgi:hypothetical protein